MDPAKKYLGKLDKKMSSISKSNIKADQKVKLYNQQLDNYLLNNADEVPVSTSSLHEEVPKPKDPVPVKKGKDIKNRLSLLARSNPEVDNILPDNDEHVTKTRGKDRKVRMNELVRSQSEVNEFSSYRPYIKAKRLRESDEEVNDKKVRVVYASKPPDLDETISEPEVVQAHMSKLLNAPTKHRTVRRVDFNKLMSDENRKGFNFPPLVVQQQPEPQIFENNVDMLNESIILDLAKQLNTSLVPEINYIKNEKKNPFLPKTYKKQTTNEQS